jgi:O-antigen ligase
MEKVDFGTFLPSGLEKRWLYLYLLVCILSIFGWIATDQFFFFLVPIALLGLTIAVFDFQILFYALFFFIPLSIEVELPGGLATDLPTEPLMWLLLVCLFTWGLRHWHQANMAFLRHPITILLAMHIAWIMLCTLASEQFVFSLKFLLAKFWYLAALFILPLKILHSPAQIRKMIWAVSIPLLFTIIFVSIKHAQYGFSFEMSNEVMDPFYRNHVIYACFPAIFIPYLWFVIPYYKENKTARTFFILSIIAALFAINFAYTRAAYIALLAAAGMYYIIKWRLTKTVIILSLIGFTALIGFITRGDNYFLFAPDFSRTITHKKFENLLEATTKLEDISTMERVYRWVAAAQMVKNKPYLGYGPGNFYSFYQRYTVTAFKTYVSDNPEKSGIHNYYLMTLVEQGVIGLILFLALCFGTLMIAERTWHSLPDGNQRYMIMAATLSFTMLLLLMLMNDLIETDKLGSFFFVNMAIIISTYIHRAKHLV